jgi:hypothetical protein
MNMNETKVKFTKKGAGKRLRELYEKKREQSRASDELLEQLRAPTKDQQKKSALNPDAEI